MKVKIQSVGSDIVLGPYHTYDTPKIGETVVVSPECFNARVIDVKHALLAESWAMVEPILIVAPMAEEDDSATEDG